MFLEPLPAFVSITVGQTQNNIHRPGRQVHCETLSIHALAERTHSHVYNDPMNYAGH